MGPGATHSTASAALEAALASVLALTEGGEKLQITRLGTFSRREQRPCRRYDISSGGYTESPAATRLAFTPARGFPEKPI